MLRQLENAMQRLDYLAKRLVHPAQKAQQQTLHLAQLQQRLQGAMGHLLQKQSWRLQAQQQRLQSAQPAIEKHASRTADLRRRVSEAMRRSLERYTYRLDAAQQHLQHLDPQQVFARDYSMVQDVQGRVVADSAELSLGQPLQVTFAKGGARVEVTNKE